MHRKMVAIIDFRSSKGIVNIRRMLEKREEEGNVSPGNWKMELGNFKSMIVFDDGSCLLHRLSAASMAGRMKKESLIKGMYW